MPRAAMRDISGIMTVRNATVCSICSSCGQVGISGAGTKRSGRSAEIRFEIGLTVLGHKCFSIVSRLSEPKARVRASSTRYGERRAGIQGRQMANFTNFHWVLALAALGRDK
jgi:hypothetical protein